MNQSEDLSVLEDFYANGLITEVLGQIKSGKEATVFCCRAHPATGAKYLAAKIYRATEHRNFKNDAVYQAGRVILDSRLRRACKKKTHAGRRTQFGEWVSHEFGALTKLYAAGAEVPRPYAQAGSAILMEFVGDESRAAELLKAASLKRDEAAHIFKTILENIELFLACNYIHADLSAFNILYWQGRIKIIDFPQAIDPRLNRNAFELLSRDIANVCDHFSRYDLSAGPAKIAIELWRRFLHGEL